MYLEEIIEGCKNEDDLSQKELYMLFSKKIMGICLRYSKCKADAEDLFQESFIKIFNNIHFYEGKGSFEGWIRKIVVNTALKEFRKKNPYFSLSEPEAFSLPVFTNDYIVEKLTADEIIQIIEGLPEGYKIVFNLFAVEGYTHKEISEMMNISPGTSKSQYFNAKKTLQSIVRKKVLVSQPLAAAS